METFGRKLGKETGDPGREPRKLFSSRTRTVHRKKDVLEAKPEWDEVSSNPNCVTLLKLICTVMFTDTVKRELCLTIFEALANYFKLRQGEHVSLQAHYDRFKNNITVIDHVGSAVGVYNKLVNEEYSKLLSNVDTVENAVATALALNAADIDVPTQKEKAKEEAHSAFRKRTVVLWKDRFHAMAYLMTLYRKEYGRLLEELHNSYLLGRDNYPKSLIKAYYLAVNYQNDPRNHSIVVPQDGGSLMLVNAEEGDEHEEESSNDKEGTVLNTIGSLVEDDSEATETKD